MAPFEHRTLTGSEAPWLSQESLAEVLAALSSEGHSVRITGGAVRDSLIGKGTHPEDIDLVSSLDVIAAKARLKAIGLRGSVHPFMPEVLFFDLSGEPGSARHGSIVCLADGSDDAFARDAARRDLTVNALMCSPDGTVRDHFGGLADAHARILRFVSEEAVAADPVKVLRYFRMRSRIGESDPHPDALAIVRRNAHRVRTGVGFRYVRELALLIDETSSQDLMAALRLMQETGVLGVILPRADLGRFERYLAETRLGMGGEAFQGLAMLGAAGDPFLEWGDWRDDAVAKRAESFELAGDDLSMSNVSDSFRTVVENWRERPSVRA